MNIFSRFPFITPASKLVTWTVLRRHTFSLQLQLYFWNQKMHLFVGRRAGNDTDATVTALKQAPFQRQIGLRRGNKDSCGTDGEAVSWNAMITRYVKKRKLKDARQVFDKMPKRTVVSWNAMIAGYTQNGKIEEARELFDKMPKRNVVSWTAMITGYAQNGHIECACQLFDKMPERNVASWNAMITGYIQNRRIQEARQLFDRMPERNVVSWTAMLTAYSQSGRIENARQLLDTMPERNVVSYTAMMTGYAQNGRIEEARHLFDKMTERNAVSWSVMIQGYVQHGRIDDARELFDAMPNKNVVSYTAMITGYCQHGNMDEASKLFDQMHERDVMAWNAMIAGFAQNGRTENARQLFNKLPERDLVSWNLMIAAYTQSGRLKDARQLLDKMPEPNIVSWNSMIAGYVQNGEGEEAFKLFSQMQKAGMNPDQSTYSTVLSVCAYLASMELGQQFHGHTIKAGLNSNVFVESSLITMYAKSGSIERASQVFDKMPERDVVSWNAMISGYAQCGQGKEALQLFEQMQQTGLKPDHITFLGVLCACSHAGLVDEARHHFNSMSQDHCITPRVDHYACMVDLLARAGHLDEAKNLVTNMHFEPNASMWGALLSACRIYCNLELGKHAAERLFELEPQDSTTYVLLSNIYAATGRWDEAAKVRTMMKYRGVKKQPGCSWIEIKNTVHAFHVGDISHPETEKIYAALDRLVREMEAAGYVPNTSLLLND